MYTCSGRLAEAAALPMEPSVMQEIGSPMYCLAVTRMVQTSSKRTVTRECSLKTTLSTRTASSCRRHLMGAKRSSMVITCSFVSGVSRIETKHDIGTNSRESTHSELSSVWSEKSFLRRFRTTSDFTSQRARGKRQTKQLKSNHALQ